MPLIDTTALPPGLLLHVQSEPWEEECEGCVVCRQPNHYAMVSPCDGTGTVRYRLEGCVSKDAYIGYPTSLGELCTLRTYLRYYSKKALMRYLVEQFRAGTLPAELKVSAANPGGLRKVRVDD